ncbi:Ankyrin-3 [Lasiodiplodia theobromae]|nr:Ankyrin-3 [Lasiodiplodia theobromae]
MGSIDLLCYAQPILAAIGIIGVLHYCFKFYHFLFPNGNEVTEFTKSQISAEDETINIQQTEPMYRDTIATDDGSRKKLQCGAYSIGIITALPNEMKAAISILDEEHRPPSDFCRPRDDYNPYVWGSMSTRSEESHNVVIASFPAKRPGTVTAADVARLMVTAFPSIRLGLMVGIGGGVPGPNDIRLGDVVVSQGSGTTGGVVQYDFGKEEEEGFRRQGQTDNVKSLRADLQKISDEQIRDWLEPSEQQNNFDQAQDEIERYQTESTWFFEHEDYRDWASHKIHHIWLHGQSGCGKTVLASTMVKQLSAERKLSLYFFFDFRDTKKQSLESLLRSLIWQLFSLSDSEDVKTLVRQLYEDRKFPTPTIEKLKHTFDKIVEEMDEVQVVLDALDESTRKGTDRDELLRWLKPRTQYEGPGVYKLRTIITSQSDQQDIMNVLGSSSVGKREIRIENETAKVKETIHQYIHKRLSNDGGFAEWRKPPNKSLLLDPESQEQGGMDNWHPIMKEMEQCLVDKAGLM